MTKTEKPIVVSELSEKLKKAKAVIVAEYRGMKVSESSFIRKELKKNAGEFKVVKNTLARRAIAGSEWSPLEKYLKGPMALIISEQDPVMITKILAKYAESVAALKLTAACLNGKVLDTKEIIALSKLPSKEELYAKMLGTLMAPATNFVRVLQAVPQKLAIALKAIAEKKQ